MYRFEKHDMMTKRQVKRILSIVFIMASLGSLCFVPWILVKAWILPLPDTVSMFEEEEQDIHSFIYVYEHTGLLVGYQSIAEYHKDIDAVVIQFNNTTGL